MPGVYQKQHTAIKFLCFLLSLTPKILKAARWKDTVQHSNGGWYACDQKRTIRVNEKPY